MKKLNKKWMIAGIVAAVLTVSCVAVAAVAYQSNTPQEVSEQQAKEIAFKHAGVSEGDVSELEVHRELENGREVYSVEFGANGKEYEYDVRISDGEIVKSSEEARGLKESQAQQAAEESTLPAESQASATETAARDDASQPSGNAGSTESTSAATADSGNSQVKITLEEARQKALAKVSGATEKDIRLELDWDDGRPVYEGEIYYGNMEYEFEIDANTGNFLEWSSDYRD